MFSLTKSLTPCRGKFLSMLVQAVPQLLYQLGPSAPHTSLAALRMLHNAGRYCTAGDPMASALDALQLELYPLFSRPSKWAPADKGNGSAGVKAQLSTFALLPEPCQVSQLHVPCCTWQTE